MDKKIIDVCSQVYSGGTPNSRHDEYYANGIIPWLNTGEISFNRIRKTEKYITEAGYNNSSAKWVPANSVIVAMYGATAGKVAITKIPLTTNQACCNLIINKEIADYRYVYYFLCNKYIELASLANGGAQQNLNAGQIKDFPIALPELKMQTKIADLLSMLDDKIELNNEINNNLEQQAATVFAKWIHGCTDRITIGELSYNILDYTPIENELVRLLNSSDVTEGVFPASPLVPNTDLKGHFKKRFQFGDILYSEIRPRNHHYGFALFDASEYLASTRLMVIRAVEKKVSPAMLYQYLLLPEVEAEFTLKTESRSGTFPQGNYADMASIIVPYSSINTQTEVSKVLSQIRNTMALKQLENQRLSELRDTLLPKLMSGEIDVTDIDI